jgi:hypothetical protein
MVSTLPCYVNSAVVSVAFCCRVCSQLASLRKECGAALQVVADVGLGRWVKLLSARSAANTRLKQYELRQLLDLSEQVGQGCAADMRCRDCGRGLRCVQAALLVACAYCGCNSTC